MSKVKYNSIKTSNGEICFNKIGEQTFDLDYSTFLRIYNVQGGNYKIYINNSEDYILLEANEELKIEDFALIKMRIVSNMMANHSKLKWYACK